IWSEDESVRSTDEQTFRLEACQGTHLDQRSCDDAAALVVRQLIVEARQIGVREQPAAANVREERFSVDGCGRAHHASVQEPPRTARSRFPARDAAWAVGDIRSTQQ